MSASGNPSETGNIRPQESAVSPRGEDEVAKLTRIIQPVVQASRLYLEKVELGIAGTDRTVHVVVDLPEDETGGVSLDVIAALSQQLSDALDSADIEDGRPYTLDVSSPGVSRPLTETRHWKRNLGRLVNITLNHGGSGRTEPLVGRLSSVDEDSVTVIPQLPAKKGVKPKTGEPQIIKYTDIKRASVEVEFNQSAAEEETTDGH